MENSKINVLQCNTIRPTTYLKELSVEDPEIVFVYLKGVKDEVCSPINTEPSKTEKDDSLDLTGNPLQVDLNGDESQLSTGLKCHINLWKEEEESHFPMEIKRARQFINNQLRMKNCEGESSIPIYVICDGKNPENTVVLGAQKSEHFLMTTKINILGYLPRDHEKLSLEQMVRNHIRNCRLKDCKINYTTKFRYYLYGTYLQKIKNTYDLDMYGSICLQAICKDKCLLNDPQNSSLSKLILQIIVGHPLSSVNSLWKDMCLLQSFLDILSNPEKNNTNETLLSEDFLEVTDIYKELSSAIGFNFLKLEAKKSFSLTNIRVESILDKLWNILKRCENLSDSRESFHFLFEELAEAQTNLKIADQDDSNIATILRGILNGNLAVPTITLAQALEFLFELGTEKLKNDYQAILKNYCPTSEFIIAATWSQLKQKLSLQGGFRKTRITSMLKPGTTDLNHNISKLTYLVRMHMTIEYIYLVKTETTLPEDIFDYICESVYKNYLEKQSVAISDVSDLEDLLVCDFEVEVDIPEKKLKKNDITFTWSLKMTSLNNDMEVTTLYHMSQQPIFPTTIYDDISTINTENEVQFYVTKMEKYKNIL